MELNPAVSVNKLWRGFWEKLGILVLGTALSLGVTLVVLRSGVQPLRTLAASARRFGQGEYTVRILAEGPPETAQCIQAFNSMAGNIVFITTLGAFFPIVLNTIHGVEGIDRQLVRAATSLGAGRAAIFREVVVPGALPSIVTGLSVGLGVSWICLISAEMISGQFGVGYFTWVAYGIVKYSQIVVGMLTIRRGHLSRRSRRRLALAILARAKRLGPAWVDGKGRIAERRTDLDLDPDRLLGSLRKLLS